MTRRHVRTIRVLTLSAGLMTAAAMLAAPVQADPTADSFLAALNNSGIGYPNPSTAVTMGQSICPMLSQPGGTFANVASSMVGSNGMSPQSASLFTSIAVAMFCPSMISSLAGGTSSVPFQIPGL
jgi:hypothetical protein